MTSRTASFLLALALAAGASPAAGASESGSLAAGALTVDLREVANLRSAGRFDQALTLATRIVESHPESLEAHVAFQDLYLAQARERKILSAYLERTKRDGATADDHYLYARLVSERRKPGIYRRALRLDPDHFWTLCALGHVEASAGRFDKAEAHFEHARRTHPDSAVPLNGLGWIAERRGDLVAAMKHYHAAVEIDASMALPRINLAMLLVGAQKLDEAREHLEAAREIAPSDPMPLLVLGMANAAGGDLEAALANYSAAVELQGNSIESLNFLATTYVGLEQFDLAQGALERAIEIAPQHGPTRFGFAYLELARGNPAAALDWVKKVLADDFRSAPGHYLAGLCLEATDDARGAERSYRRAIDLDRDNPGYHRALASLAASRKNWREAIKHYQTVVKLSDDAPDALLDLAFAQVGAGAAREAAETFEAVVAVRPDELAAWMNLGLLYQTSLHDKERAIAAYESYLSRGGDDPRVKAWLAELR